MTRDGILDLTLTEPQATRRGGGVAASRLGEHMDGQTRAAAVRCWEQQVRTPGDLVRGAVEALEQFAGEGAGGFEALKVALIEEAARRIACAALRRRTG